MTITLSEVLKGQLRIETSLRKSLADVQHGFYAIGAGQTVFNLYKNDKHSIINLAPVGGSRK